LDPIHAKDDVRFSEVEELMDMEAFLDRSRAGEIVVISETG
jgi:hypothetical protein